MDLYNELFSIVREFSRNDIKYSIIGGIAMALHDEPRFTKDIDFLIMSEEIDNVRGLLEKLGYFESAEPWKFKKTDLTLHRFMKTEGEEHLIVDILVGNEEKHKRIIVDSIEEEWEEGKIRIISKADLIWMKELRNSDQDRVDIGRLKNDKD